MTPHTTLRPPLPASARSISAEVDDRSDRALWKRNETALAVAALAGVMEALVASWIVAVAMRDLIAALQANGVGATVGVGVGVALARVGLVVAEALGALAVSVAAGAISLRMAHGAAEREGVPFWTRVVAVVRIVGGAIVFGAGWKLGWSALLESRGPWLLLVLAAAQLGALVVGSFRPISIGPRRTPSTPARASGKQSA